MTAGTERTSQTGDTKWANSHWPKILTVAILIYLFTLLMNKGAFFIRACFRFVQSFTCLHLVFILHFTLPHWCVLEVGFHFQMSFSPETSPSVAACWWQGGLNVLLDVNMRKNPKLSIVFDCDLHVFKTKRLIMIIKANDSVLLSLFQSRQWATVRPIPAVFEQFWFEFDLFPAAP